jgi:hypothetical protein
MNRYIAGTLSIAVAIGPASALDVGLGGQVGGIGVGAGLGVGKEGAAVGGGTSVDGLGGANVGGSVGTSKGSLDAGVGASGNLGGASGGSSAGVGGKSSGGDGAGAAPGDTGAGSGSTGSAGAGAGAAPGGSSGGSAAGSGSAGSGAAGTTAVIGRSKGVRQAIALPRKLLPSKTGRDKFARNAWGYPLLAPIKAIPGTPLAVVRVCRQAIESAATSLGAVRVHAASAGPLSRQRRGALTAPIHVRIDYARQGGIEVRQARISCRLDAAGRVIAVT